MDEWSLVGGTPCSALAGEKRGDPMGTLAGSMHLPGSTLRLSTVL